MLILRTPVPLPGRFEEINGVHVYTAEPEDGQYPKDTVLLYLPDVFGIQLPNAQVSYFTCCLELEQPFQQFSCWRMISPGTAGG